MGFIGNLVNMMVPKHPIYVDNHLKDERPFQKNIKLSRDDKKRVSEILKNLGHDRFFGPGDCRYDRINGRVFILIPDDYSGFDSPMFVISMETGEEVDDY